MRSRNIGSVYRCQSSKTSGVTAFPAERRRQATTASSCAMWGCWIQQSGIILSTRQVCSSLIQPATRSSQSQMCCRSVGGQLGGAHGRGSDATRRNSAADCGGWAAARDSSSRAATTSCEGSGKAAAGGWGLSLTCGSCRPIQSQPRPQRPEEPDGFGRLRPAGARSPAPPAVHARHALRCSG